MRVGLPLMKNVLTPCALITLNLTAECQLQMQLLKRESMNQG